MPKRLGLYREHSREVDSIAWSPNSQYIVSMSLDGAMRIWDAMTGNDCLTYTHPTGGMGPVAWSPNGKYIALGVHGDKIVQVRDAVNGACLFTYPEHPANISSVAWSPDSKCIASGSLDGTVQMWYALSGFHYLTYEGHVVKRGVLPGHVRSISWSPDGKYIASAASFDVMHVWDALMGISLFTYPGYSTDIDGISDPSVDALAWSPDGTKIAVEICDRVIILDATTVSQHFWPPFSTTAHEIGICWNLSNISEYALAWSPDSQYLVVGAYSNTTVFHVNTQKRSVEYPTRGHLVAWSPDGKYIATSRGSLVEVWQAP